MIEGHIERLNAALEGRYRIERELGQGGMATVYLADDLKHERKVALKVLKPELAAVVGGERFLAEIKTTANLQHPHILPLFDSGEADTYLFYVMPYVEGETLRDRLDREHQLPVDEAVQIAKNVAEALDYAHSHGVIHRDIKPANILLQAGKPVLSDFGIALAVGVAGGGRLTETGLSLGTPHYMSPEQATGDLRVGAATDVYALGCVLYEMLVGEPPYRGSTPQAILGKIITGEPTSVMAQRKSVAANVEAAIAKALEKLPADRFSGAQEFAMALEDPGFRHGAEASGVAASAAPWMGASMVLGALALVSTAALGWILVSGDPSLPQPIVRSVLTFPDGAGLSNRNLNSSSLAVSPAGNDLVYVGTDDGMDRLYHRPFDRDEFRPVPGTEGATGPFFSPDGQWVGFFSGGSLRKVLLAGGVPFVICELTSLPHGATWRSDDTILYGLHDSGIWQVAATGGTPEPLTTPQREGGTVDHHGPEPLPGGRAFLFTLWGGSEATSHIALKLLDTGEEREILPGSNARYASTGHIVFTSGGSFWAVRFDLQQLEVVGEPFYLVENVARTAPGSGAAFALSAAGTLVFAASSEEGSASTLVFVNRDGQELPVDIEPQDYFYPRISPEGGRLAVAVVSTAGDSDLWVLNLDRGSRSRVTFGGNNRFFPTWTPDGERLTFADGTAGSNTLRLAAADGSGQMVTLLEREGLQFPTSWSPDGRALAYYESSVETSRDLWVLPVGGDPEPFLITPFQERGAAFSPAGAWLAYVSDKSGQDEIYVQPYPGPGPEFTVSTAGGTEPLWSRDGSELFYRTENELMVVAVDAAGDAFRGGTPAPLFFDAYMRDASSVGGTPNYDIVPDGQRFIMVRSDATAQNEVTLIQNFFEVLRERVPN